LPAGRRPASLAERRDPRAEEGRAEFYGIWPKTDGGASTAGGRGLPSRREGGGVPQGTRHLPWSGQGVRPARDGL